MLFSGKIILSENYISRSDRSEKIIIFKIGHDKICRLEVVEENTQKNIFFLIF
jgi:hypothetical protein